MRQEKETARKNMCIPRGPCMFIRAPASTIRASRAIIVMSKALSSAFCSTAQTTYCSRGTRSIHSAHWSAGENTPNLSTQMPPYRRNVAVFPQPVMPLSTKRTRFTRTRGALRTRSFPLSRVSMRIKVRTQVRAAQAAAAAIMLSTQGAKLSSESHTGAEAYALLSPAANISPIKRTITQGMMTLNCLSSRVAVAVSAPAMGFVT
mmetsp:Transcript_28064/g.62164  ORF Transcript_28064/g.62164 Transcript_28064/m.62164 type:complete len:205 (-) Transcript_28064:183-797(-)